MAVDRGGEVSACRSRATQHRGLLFFALAAVVAALALPGIHLLDGDITGDIPTYERYGDAMVRGEIPYRDFFVEYPPGALPAFLLPELAGSHYVLAFKLLMLGLLAVLAALAWRRAGAVVLLAATPLLLGWNSIAHYDLWPTLLAALGLVLVLDDRSRLGFAALGLGTAAKLFPIVLVPLATIYVWRRSGRREALVSLGWGAVVLTAFVLPFVVLAPGGVWFSMRFQLERPLEIATLGSGFLLAVHKLGFGTPDVISSYNSQNLAGALPNGLAVAQAVLLCVVLLAVWILFARGPAEPDRLVLAGSAALVATLVFGKVMSHGYLVWPLAALPILAGAAIVPWVLLAVAFALTQSLLVWDGVGLGAAGWIVFARNAVLVGLLALLVWTLVSRRPRPP